MVGRTLDETATTPYFGAAEAGVQPSGAIHALVATPVDAAAREATMIRLRLFGPIELCDGNGAPVHGVVAHSKHVALLAYTLIAQRGAHRRARLTALLWPDLDDVRARNALSKTLHHLRRLLGDDLFISHGDDAIEIDPTRIRCDVTQFVEAATHGRHAEAIDLYMRGELLDGFHIADLSTLERWIDVERVRLRERAVQSAAALSDASDCAGDRHESVRWARVAYQLAPDDEVTLRRLVARQAAAGDRAGSITTFNEFATRIARDLETEPSPETSALVECIRADSAGVARERDHPAPRGAASSEQSAIRSAEPVTQSERAVAGPVPALRPSRRIFGRPAVPSAIAAGVAILSAIAWRHAHGGDAYHHPRLGSLDEVRRHVAELQTSPVSSTLRARPARVVVAPWTIETGDTADLALGRVAAEWIVEGIQRNGLAEVVDAQTVHLGYQSSGRPTNGAADSVVAVLAARTGATLVVTGRVYRRGDSLEVWTSLVEPTNGTVTRALPAVKGPTTDPGALLVALRSSVLGAVAQAVDSRSAELISTADRPPIFEAYREYIAGLDAYVPTPWNPEGLAHFLRAASLDTNFVLPLIWAAYATTNPSVVPLDSARARFDSLVARVAAHRAQLSPLESIELDYLEADGRADLIGRNAAAVRASELAPMSQWTYLAGSTAWRLRRYREAIGILHHLDPGRGWVRTWKSFPWMLGNSHHLLGEYEQELADAALALRGDSAALDLVEPPLIALGRDADAEALIDTAVARWPDLAVGRLVPHAIGEARVHGRSALAQRLKNRCLSWLSDSDVNREISIGETPAGTRAACLTEVGRFAEARAALWPICQPPASWLGDCDFIRYGALSARIGDTVEVSRMRRAIADEAAHRHELSAEPLEYEAHLAAIRGDRDLAVDALRRAIAFQGIQPGLHTDIDFSTLRGYAPFQRLLNPPQ